MSSVMCIRVFTRMQPRDQSRRSSRRSNPVIRIDRLFRAVVAILVRDESVALQLREVAVDRADVTLKQAGKLADLSGWLRCIVRMSVSVVALSTS